MPISNPPIIIGKITRIDEASATITYIGKANPFLDVNGYTVRIKYQQPVQAITVSTGSGLSEEEHNNVVLTKKILSYLYSKS